MPTWKLITTVLTAGLIAGGAAACGGEPDAAAPGAAPAPPAASAAASPPPADSPGSATPTRAPSRSTTSPASGQGGSAESSGSGNPRFGTQSARTPPTFAAIRDGRVAVLSTGTGRVLRYLTGARPVGEDTNPAVDDRRQTVYFTRGTGTCNAPLLAVPYGGGAVRVVDQSPGRHFYPTVDRSSHRIAYLSSSCEPGLDVVTVRDLRTGRTRGITVPSGNAELQSMAWVQNRPMLAVVVWRLDLPERPTELRLLDARRSHTVLQGRLVAPAAGCVFSQVARRGPRNELVAAEICYVDGERFQRLVTVNPVAGTRGSVLGRVPADQGFVNSLDVDGTGRHVIYMAVPSVGVPQAHTWRNGASRRLATDVIYPSW